MGQYRIDICRTDAQSRLPLWTGFDEQIETVSSRLSLEKIEKTSKRSFLQSVSSLKANLLRVVVAFALLYQEWGRKFI